MSEADCNAGPANLNVVNVQGPAGDKGQLGAMGPSGDKVAVSFLYTYVDQKTKCIAPETRRNG